MVGLASLKQTSSLIGHPSLLLAHTEAVPDCAARLDLSSVEGRDNKGADFAALQERLLLKAQERDLKLMKLKAEIDRRVLEQCTFQPLVRFGDLDRGISEFSFERAWR